jgi:phytoene dehydrogenase-like protein
VLEQHEDVAGGGTHQFDLNGYRFDSGLHYTVPWSVPIFALTCLKSIDEVCPFDLMGDANDVVDKIYLRNPEESASEAAQAKSFDMKHKEAHLAQLYADFPDEHKALDEFMVISDRAMLFVKYFLFARLLPQWMQTLYWQYVVPRSLIAVASQTAKEILPKLTSNKRLISLLSGMWIDTGARPDVASFMMTAAVFRGVAMEGGCYPRNGSEDMAIELARVINDNGGVRYYKFSYLLLLLA